MRSAEWVDLYGFQRTFIKNAARDLSENARKQFDGNVWELLSLDGALDVGRLLSALEHVTDYMDVLKGRAARVNDKDVFAFDAQRQRYSFSAITNNGTLKDFGQSGLKEILRGVALGLRDLQNDPPMHVSIIRISRKRHLMLIVMDHLVSDGRTLAIFIRQLFKCYQKLGSVEGLVDWSPFPSYFEFARSQAYSSTKRSAAADFWSERFAESDKVHKVPQFPGGRQKKVERRFLAQVHCERIPPAVVAAAREISYLLRLPIYYVFLGALALVASTWTQQLPGIEYFRTGRYDRTLVNIPGPLFELVTAIMPQRIPDSVLEHLELYGRANYDAPPCYGVTVRELEGGIPVNRMITFNSIPPIKEIEIEGMLIRPAYDLVEQLSGFQYRSRFGIDMQLVTRNPHHLVMTTKFDPDFVPRGERLTSSVGLLIMIAAQNRHVSLTEMRSTIAADW